MEIILDGKRVKAYEGENILQVAKRNNVYIPTLCHLESLPGQATCRLCMVEVVGRGKSEMVASCVYPVSENMEVVTDSEDLRKMRKTLLMLYAAMLPESEAINKLLKLYEVTPNPRFQAEEDNECFLCGLCVRACEQMGVYAISTVFRGTKKKISTPFDEPSPTCIGCGSCAYVCPTHAIKVQEEKGKRTIWGKTFSLVKCRNCGKYFATEEELAYLKEKLGEEEARALCESCRKKEIALKFKEAYKL